MKMSDAVELANAALRCNDAKEIAARALAFFQERIRDIR
jgi:hypothetical protein